MFVRLFVQSQSRPVEPANIATARVSAWHKSARALSLSMFVGPKHRIRLRTVWRFAMLGFAC